MFGSPKRISDLNIRANTISANFQAGLEAPLPISSGSLKEIKQNGMCMSAFLGNSRFIFRCSKAKIKLLEVPYWWDESKASLESLITEDFPDAFLSSKQE